jgi:DNA-binding MarR family transcriptional regulator
MGKAKANAKKSAPRATARRGTREFPGGLDAVCFALARAYYNYLGLLERILAETGLDQHVRPGMGHILFALFEKDDQVIKDIAARVRLSYSTLSGLLARMEKAGVVACRRDDRDGRAVRVCLTPLGRSLEPKCHQTVARINRVMLSGLSDAEIDEAQHLLARMNDAMRADEKRAGPGSS